MTVNREKTQQAAERHIRRGNWEKAIGLYQELVKDDPADLRSKLKLADLYIRVEDIPQAIETYAAVGKGYEKTREYDKAAAVYKVARNAVPENLEVSELLGNLYAKMGKNKEALQLLGEVYLGYSQEQKAEKSQKILEQMTLLDPEDVGLKIQLAERYKKTQDTHRALSVFYDAADLLRAEGRSDELFQVMQRILYLSPDSLEARKEVIKGLLERNEERRALKHFRTAVSAAPDDLELLALLGTTFESLGSIDNAVEVYEKMIAIYGGQSYKPRVINLQDRILQIAPDSPAARRIRKEKGEHAGISGASEVIDEEASFDLLNGEDLFGDRDILDDVEFLDDPFGVLSSDDEGVKHTTSHDFADLTQDTFALQNRRYGEMRSFQGERTEVTSEAVGLDAPTYVHSADERYLDEAPTQEDVKRTDTSIRKDVTHLLRRVDSFFQFNLFGQADELTRDIINLAPDNFYARDQRRRICENLGNTEEAAEQLMEMARIVVDDPPLSSKYLGQAMTMTDNPQRFEDYAKEIRSQWAEAKPPQPEQARTSMTGDSRTVAANTSQNQKREENSSSGIKRSFSLPKPMRSVAENDSKDDAKTPLGNEPSVPFKSVDEHPKDYEQALGFEEVHIGDAFEEIDLADLQNIPVNYITDDNEVETLFDSKDKKENDDDDDEVFDLDFLDKDSSNKKDKFANIFSDIDLDFSQFGNKSLSSAFVSKDNIFEAESSEASMLELPSIEVGEIYLQSGRYEEAIDTLEPLLNDTKDRVKAQLLLADVYAELGDVPKAAEFLLCVINEEVSSNDERTEAQNKLSKLS